MGSALLPKLRLRLAKAFKGLLGRLGPHHVGGWVCAALWRSSFGDTALREAFAAELLEVEDALRANNFAVWKVCGLHQVKVRKEEWATQQQKAGKAKRLFNELIEGGDPEAAKAAAEARAKAAEDAAWKASEDAAKREGEILSDPTIAALLPTSLANDDDVTADHNESEVSQSRLLQMVNQRGSKTEQGGTKRKKKVMKKKGSKRQEVDTLDAPEESTKSAPVDTSLQETLKLISAHGAGRP